MHTSFIGNSLLGDELAIEQQLISDNLTCFVADVLDRVPLVAEAPYPKAPHWGALQPCYIDTSYSKNRAPLPPLAEELPHPKLMCDLFFTLPLAVVIQNKITSCVCYYFPLCINYFVLVFYIC